jgi:hypothetical protein
MWHGKARADDRWVLIGSIFINLNGLRWRDAQKERVCLLATWKKQSRSALQALDGRARIQENISALQFPVLAVLRRDQETS